MRRAVYALLRSGVRRTPEIAAGLGLDRQATIELLETMALRSQEWGAERTWRTR